MRTIKVEIDDTPQDPREFAAAGILYQNNSRYGGTEGPDPYASICVLCDKVADDDCECEENFQYRMKGSVWFRSLEGNALAAPARTGAYGYRAVDSEEEFYALPEFEKYADLTEYKLNPELAVAIITANRYDHGYSISTTPNPKDSTYLYMSPEEYESIFEEEFDGSENAMNRAINLLTSDFETFNDWASGNVYGYVIEVEDENGHREQVDSCWGFYGDGAIDAMLEHMTSAEDEKLLIEAWEKRYG